MNQPKINLSNMNVEHEPMPNIIPRSEIRSPGRLFSALYDSSFTNLARTNKRNVNSKQSLRQPHEPCECSDILVCDDNPFQLNFYSLYFKKQKNCCNWPIREEDLKLSLSTSGENLISTYKTMKKCGCEKPIFVITDLEMGTTQITGIETSIELRAQGFTGPIIMNTSKPRTDSKNSDSDSLLTNKVINFYVSKQSPGCFSTVVENVMRQSEIN